MEKLSQVIPEPPKPPVPPKSKYICTTCGNVESGHKCPGFKGVRYFLISYVIIMVVVIFIV